MPNELFASIYSRKPKVCRRVVLDIYSNYCLSWVTFTTLMLYASFYSILSGVNFIQKFAVNVSRKYWKLNTSISDDALNFRLTANLFTGTKVERYIRSYRETSSVKTNTAIKKNILYAQVCSSRFNFTLILLLFTLNEKIMCNISRTCVDLKKHICALI